jgi:hypothetical protein
MDEFQRLKNWLTELQPPKYPFAIDQTKVARGSEIFNQQCASCHAVGGARTGTVIPIDEVKTDRNRLDEWTQGAADAYNSGAGGYTFNTSHFRKTNGYATPPLDGIWLRAPYLHNGAVPTLTDLLMPPGPASEIVLARVRRLRPGAGRLYFQRLRRREVFPFRHKRGGQLEPGASLGY